MIKGKEVLFNLMFLKNKSLLRSVCGQLFFFCNVLFISIFINDSGYFNNSLSFILCWGQISFIFLFQTDVVFTEKGAARGNHAFRVLLPLFSNNETIHDIIMVLYACHFPQNILTSYTFPYVYSEITVISF